MWIYVLLLVGIFLVAVSFLGYKVANNSYSRTSQTIGMLIFWLAGAFSFCSFWVVIWYKICKYFRIV